MAVPIRAFVLIALLTGIARPAFATFSIVARDPSTGELGLAIASRVLSVRTSGSIAEADVGVVARQADWDTRYARRAIELLRSGMSAPDALRTLLDERPSATVQIAIVDAHGVAAAATGANALDWKGHKTGASYSVQGNVLAGPEVLDAMARAFEKTTGPLAERLFAALHAGDAAGGDRRGRQSAHLLVVRKNGGYATGDDRVVDVAVDDHRDPFKELRRLLNIQQAWNLTGAAEKAFAAGDVAGADALARQLPRLMPGDSYAFATAGIYAYFNGGRAEAIRLLRTARRLDPRFAALWESLKSDSSLRRMFEDQGFVRAVFGR